MYWKTSLISIKSMLINLKHKNFMFFFQFLTFSENLKNIFWGVRRYPVVFSILVSLLAGSQVHYLTDPPNVCIWKRGAAFRFDEATDASVWRKCTSFPANRDTKTSHAQKKTTVSKRSVGRKPGALSYKPTTQTRPLPCQNGGQTTHVEVSTTL